MSNNTPDYKNDLVFIKEKSKNKDEQIENLMNFITIEAENTLRLCKNVKDMKDCTDVKLNVAEYCLQYNNNLRELLKMLGKVKENGSIEH